MSVRYERIWESRGAAAAVARTLLWPASLAYELGVRLRGAAYDRGIAPIERAPIPVVSIGNLRVGGSGKTPFALWLAERLAAAGREPAIVTRGYGTVAAREPVVASRDGVVPLSREGARAAAFRVVAVGDERELPADIADEALLLALRGSWPVVVAPDRLKGCVVAAALGCDVVLLDDGFQHRRLHRDLDVVLTAADDRLARVLPGGPLREPLTALGRADIVVTTDDTAPSGSRPSFAARQVARGLVAGLGPGATLRSIESLDGCAVVAVAGIARPERFLAMLATAGARLASMPLLFPDHHVYGSADVAAMLRIAGADRGIITTEKDFVKLRRLLPADTALEALRIDLAVDREDVLRDRVLESIEQLDAHVRGPHHR